MFSTVFPLIKVDSFVQKHNLPLQKVIVDWKIPAENFVSPLVQQAFYWHWAKLLFWAGATLFAARLLMQLLSLYKLYKNSKPGNIQDHEVRIVKAKISPFSFWQSIYINPDNLDSNDLKSVLKHEQVHVQEWHTLDILLTEISVIFYWFNPGVWLIKKAVRENIEFITDRKIVQKGIDSKAYQYSLLNISFTTSTAVGITNKFNFSTLKKRITMMNAKRSSNVNLTRYAFLFPAILICLFAISLSKAELVKKSHDAYKTIATSVKKSVLSLPKITGLTSVIHVAKPTITLLLDTTKKGKNKVMTISSFAIVDGDTIKKVNINASTTGSKTIKGDSILLLPPPNNRADFTIKDNLVLLAPPPVNRAAFTIKGNLVLLVPPPDNRAASTIKSNSILLAPPPDNRAAITIKNDTQ